MGWSKGDLVFGPVARAVIKAGAPDDAKRDILNALINGLRDCDWDDLESGLEGFEDDPVIVEVFAKHGVTPGDDDE